MKIAIIGNGGWGTANALLLKRNGHDVILWGAFGDYVEEMEKLGKSWGQALGKVGDRPFGKVR